MIFHFVVGLAMCGHPSILFFLLAIVICIVPVTLHHCHHVSGKLGSPDWCAALFRTRIQTWRCILRLSCLPDFRNWARWYGEGQGGQAMSCSGQESKNGCASGGSPVCRIGETGLAGIVQGKAPLEPEWLDCSGNSSPLPILFGLCWEYACIGCAAVLGSPC